jgi:hypothetical protein
VSLPIRMRGLRPELLPVSTAAAPRPIFIASSQVRSCARHAAHTVGTKIFSHKRLLLSCERICFIIRHLPQDFHRAAGFSHILRSGRGGAAAYSTHSPPEKISTVSPLRVRPVMCVSAAPTITSSCTTEWFMPWASSCSGVMVLPPSQVPG